MFDFHKKDEDVVQGGTRTVFAKISREEILELAILKMREREATRIFREVHIPEDFEKAAELYERCTKESCQWWVKIAEKYGIPNELNLDVDVETREVCLKPMPGDIIYEKRTGGR